MALGKAEQEPISFVQADSGCSDCQCRLRMPKLSISGQLHLQHHHGPELRKDSAGPGISMRVLCNPADVWFLHQGRQGRRRCPEIS